MSAMLTVNDDGLLMCLPRVCVCDGKHPSVHGYHKRLSRHYHVRTALSAGEPIVMIVLLSLRSCAASKKEQHSVGRPNAMRNMLLVLSARALASRP